MLEKPMKTLVSLCGPAPVIACLLAACTSASAPAPHAPAAGSVTRTVSMTEGTNMSLAVSPDGATIAASIQGTLWLIPAAGGDARAITAPELDAQEPAWSPDGRTLAFYAFAEDAWSVWTIGSDGNSLTRRSSGTNDARYPSFSPDGRSLLFSVDGEGYSAVSLDLASGALSRVLEAESVGYTEPANALFGKAGNVIYPTLSPDGSRLAYVVDGAADTLFVRPSGGGTATAVHSAETLGAPAWSPDGTGIYIVGLKPGSSRLEHVFLGNGDVRTISSTGDIFPFRPSITSRGITVAADGRIKTFSDGAAEPIETAFRATVSFSRPTYERRRYDFRDTRSHDALGLFDPALSPDGSRAVFTALGDLWMVDIASDKLSRLTDDPAIDLSPAWSPDGAEIAFASDRGGKTDLWSLAVRDRSLRQLTDLDAPANAPAWSPDGSRIAFLKDSRASIFLAGTVEVLDVATGKVTRIGEELFGPSQPSWSPTGKSIAIVARRPLTSRFREGHNTLLLLPASGQGEPVWVSPVKDRSLGRRHWNRPAWSSRGDMVYRIDDALWSVPLDDEGRLGDARRITPSGENPSWSADGRKLIFLDGDRLNVWSATTAKVSTIGARPSWRRAMPDTRLTIRAGRVFTGASDGYLTGMDVVVEGNVITDIRPAGSKPPTGVLLDASDRTLLPGFIESHTHQSSSLGRGLGIRWLSHGITSVRETGADPYEAVERREAEASGRRPGPRVFTAGPLNEGGRVSYGISETVGSIELARSAAARSRAMQLDMFKSYVREDYTVQKSVISEAHAAGIPVSGHELYPALANGADQVEHMSGTSRRGFSTKISRMNVVYQDVVALLAGSGMLITPTLALHSANGANPIPTIQSSLKRMSDAGVRMVAGTDSPFVPFADSLHVEMKLYAEAGLSNARVLRLATSEAATALGAGDQIGSVEVGKIADLVLLDGDPLEDITHTRNVAWVMKNGEVAWARP